MKNPISERILGMMGMILAVLLALFVPSLAVAASYQDQHGEWWDIPMPIWDWTPTNLNVQIDAFYLPQDEVVAICSKTLGKMEDFGCALVWPDRCKIYITKELPERTRSAVHGHETTHCYGWPADHPVD